MAIFQLLWDSSAKNEGVIDLCSISHLKLNVVASSNSLIKIIALLRCKHTFLMFSQKISHNLKQVPVINDKSKHGKN